MLARLACEGDVLYRILSVDPDDRTWQGVAVFHDGQVNPNAHGTFGTVSTNRWSLIHGASV